MTEPNFFLFTDIRVYISTVNLITQKQEQQIEYWWHTLRTFNATDAIS